MSSDINMYRERLVSPLRGFTCVLNDFPQLPLWATLCRASGTLDNTKLEHHPLNRKLDVYLMSDYACVMLNANARMGISHAFLLLGLIVAVPWIAAASD